ncbi:MAG: hypothetical protein GKR96_08170 [Gammaproteobacteria bacterium]|nr:hypothetical protein [Gammaproteobacteria bacterium]
MGDLAATLKKYSAMMLFSTCLMLLLYLGVWQLNRGLDKQLLENDLVSQHNQYTEVVNRPESWKELQHHLVRLKGRWLSTEVFLMANRVYQSQVGYEVYHPFMLADGTIILVNRGWVETNRKDLSVAMKETESVSIQGHLYLPEAGFTLGESVIDTQSWPKAMQYFNKPQLSKALGKEISEAVLVLDEKHKLAYVRTWKPSVMKSSRHFGYAFQWWGLALTLIVFGFIWKKQHFFTSK